MKIEVNIEKKYFIVLLSVVLVLGIIGIGYAFGGNNPSVVGHNIGEIDWSETIPSDVKINGLVSLKGQAVISSDDGYVRVGDLTGGDGKRSLMLRSGDLDSVVVSQSGDVGVGINNPNSKLDVAGNVNVRGKLLVANSIPIYQCPIFLSEGNCAPSTCTGALSTSSTCSWKSQAGTQCYTTTPACTFAGYLVPQ